MKIVKGEVQDLDIGCWDPSGRKGYTTHTGYYWVEEKLDRWDTYMVSYGYQKEANSIAHSGSKGPRVVKWSKWWKKHKTEKPKRLLWETKK